MLTQPGRLQSVVEKYADHFQLQPFSPSQIATIDEIPVKPIGAPDPLASSIARLAADETGLLRHVGQGRRFFGVILPKNVFDDARRLWRGKGRPGGF